MLPHVQIALVAAFHMGFLACAAAMVPALIAAIGMRDLPLRTTRPTNRRRWPTDSDTPGRDLGAG